MRSERKRRVPTYRGCWTCKARKVRCDQKPGSCGNCVKRGIACGGYHVRLRWVAEHGDSSDLDGRAEKDNGGRRQIQLDKGTGLRHTAEDIGRYLLSIDDSCDCNFSSTQGPFSVWPLAIRSQPEQEQTSVQPSPDCCSPSSCPAPDDSAPTSAERSWDAGDELDEQNGSQIDGDDDEVTRAAGNGDACLDTNSDGPTGFDDSSAPVSTMKEPFVETGLVSTINCQCVVFDSTLFTANLDMHAMSSNTWSPRHFLPKIFEDVDGEVLMHHYHAHLAETLQPLRHPRNPFRNTYVPIALEGALDTVSSGRGVSHIRVHSAIYHSLLACAAYHLWNHNKLNDRFWRLGVRHEAFALSNLKTALNVGPHMADYSILMVAMHTLVTVEIISGRADGWQVHLTGARRLQSSRKALRVVSRSTQQINETTLFLDLMVRTLDFGRLRAGSDTNELNSFSNAAISRIIRSARSYRYMYGLSPFTAAAIFDTCRLADLLTVYKDGRYPDNVPDKILRDCEELEHEILAWTLVDDVPQADAEWSAHDLEIYSLHAKAWHSATLLYYYRRIQNVSPTELSAEVAQVLECMHHVENIKQRTQPASTSMSAPITWPMFIASCESTPAARTSCRGWWQRLRHYNIGTIEQQWEIIQQIWDRADELTQYGNPELDWTNLYLSLQVQIVPI